MSKTKNYLMDLEAMPECTEGYEDRMAGRPTRARSLTYTADQKAAYKRGRELAELEMSNDDPS